MRTLNARKPFYALAAGFAVWVASADAEAQILGAAESFGVLGSSTVTNTGPSIILGNLGVSPGSAVTGFPPGIVLPPGTIHAADAVAAIARLSATTAFNSLMARPATVDLSGEILGTGGTQALLGPAVYAFSSSAQLTGQLTLDAGGNPDAEFVFQIGSTLTTASASSVILVGDAQAANVYWVVGSSATLGTTTAFLGNIIAMESITLNTGATILCGRALALNGAVTLDTNTISRCFGAGDDDGIPEDALGGLGVVGAQAAGFGASRLFGSAIMAQAGFGIFGAGPDLTGVTPQNYKPMKLGATELEEERIVNEGYHPRTWRLWTTGFGGTSSLDGNLSVSRADLDSTTAGVGVGLDYQIDRSTLVGVAGGYTYSTFSVDQLMTRGSLEGGHVALYGLKRYGPLYVAGLVDYAHFSNDTRRSIDWIISDLTSADFGSDLFGARTEAGWRYSTGPHNVTPFAALDLASLRSDGFLEESAGILGLTFQDDRATSFTSSLGIQFDTWVPLQNGQILRPFARVAWVHEFYPDLSVDSRLTLAPEATFALDGIFATEDVARVNTGFGLELTEHTGLYAYFDGEFSGYSQSYAGNGGIKVSW